MYPILFYIGDFAVHSYRFFTMLALVTGVVIYFRLTRLGALPPEKRVILWTGALTGGILGTKAADIISHWDYFVANIGPYLFQSEGTRTVLGGIIGGYFGVKLAKRILGITLKTGDPFALALLPAMGIGRIGCFLGGCCYGKPAEGWYTVFLAGANRYPTQLMEMGFDFLLFAVLWKLRGKMKYEGDIFKLFVTSYATIRFLIEFIRTEPVVWNGLTVYQLMALPLIVAGSIYFFKRYCR